MGILAYMLICIVFIHLEIFEALVSTVLTSKISSAKHSTSHALRCKLFFYGILIRTKSDIQIPLWDPGTIAPGLSKNCITIPLFLLITWNPY